VGKLFTLCKQELIDEEVKNFLQNEAELRDPTLKWAEDDLFDYSENRILPPGISFLDGFTSDDSIPGGSLFPIDPITGPTRGDIVSLERVCDILASSLGDFHLERDGYEDSEVRPKHGTGRVSNQRKDESKFDFTFWPAKLDRVFAYDWYAVTDHGQWRIHSNPDASLFINHEHPSKLIAVPKTQNGPRLIGSEPNYHLWIQQLVRGQIESKVKTTLFRHCISFGDQSKNRDLALTSSIDGTLATVDLKSASDRLSCWTIERAFRRNYTFLERIHASRTRSMVGTLYSKPFRILLRKCFTQGSACTFPVQTLTYSMVAIAAVIISDGVAVNSSSINSAAKEVRVFGDDIIVPNRALEKLVELLTFLQLKVNLTKTFSKGKFRESCGMDAYDGVDVTPARLRAFSTRPSHETAISMLEGANNFFKRGMWNVSEWIASHLRKYTFPVVAVTHNNINEYRNKAVRDSGGYSSFCGSDDSFLRKRWNPHYQRYEVMHHFLTSNSKKVATQSDYDLTEFLFGKSPNHNRLRDLLDPAEGGIGVVVKKSSVMRRGWKPASSQRS
jgi:hypothetical protein